MLCELNHKKVALDYSFYSVKIRLKCPFCAYNSTKKSITYTTLRQLVFHISNQHDNEGNYYQFSFHDIKFLMQMIALSKEWRLLD
ncbi:MAG: hypothetical protein COA77_08855 [Thaumarchaeota archaeon]|nr:MAG: hypothetical protein COA77_08855 [Nitrososphaerota archaeon]